MKTDINRKTAPKTSRVQEPFFKSAGENTQNSQTSQTFFPKIVKNHSPQSLIQASINKSFTNKEVPAWSKGGSIFLGASFFAANEEKQTEILQHESVHALHQRSSHTDNSATARNHAENIANNPNLANSNALAVPAPSILRFPPQTHNPWNQVFLGHDYIIGEIISNGITLRILINFSDIKIVEKTKMSTMAGMKMPIITMTKSAVYHCGKHPYKPLLDYVKRLKELANEVAIVNSKIPAGSMWRTNLVVISPNFTNQAFRVANGKGVIELNKDDFKTPIILDTIAHEVSHGIFEYHNSAGNPNITKRIPDNFALSIADIFVKLSKTKLVNLPTKKFNPRIKPTSPSASGSAQPAGLVMVYDTLWSGSGGHPWSVDEFFASAYGAYLRDKSLLNKIIDHYVAYDPAIKSLKPLLINLLDIVGDQGKIKNIVAPVGNSAGVSALGSLNPVPDHTNPISVLGLVNELINPLLLKGPSNISCPVKRKRRKVKSKPKP